MLACKDQIKQEMSETMTTVDFFPKILKSIELFNDHIDSPRLNDLYDVIKSGNKPSLYLLSELLDDAQTNHKLLRWIEVLLRQL